MANYLELVILEEDEKIVEFKERGEELYIVLKGKIEIKK
jgi:hypothetical protein